MENIYFTNRNYVLRFIAFLICALSVGSGTALASPECIRGEGPVQLFITDPSTGAFFGIGDFVLDGKLETVDIRFTTIAPTQVAPDGTITNIFAMEYLFEDGSTLIATDDAVAFPSGQPGIFNVIARIIVENGTGRFEGAYGRNSGDGTLSFITNTGLLDAQLRICGFKKEKDKDKEHERD